MTLRIVPADVGHDDECRKDDHVKKRNRKELESRYRNSNKTIFTRRGGERSPIAQDNHYNDKRATGHANLSVQHGIATGNERCLVYKD